MPVYGTNRLALLFVVIYILAIVGLLIKAGRHARSRSLGSSRSGSLPASNPLCYTAWVIRIVEPNSPVADWHNAEPVRFLSEDEVLSATRMGVPMQTAAPVRVVRDSAVNNDEYHRAKRLRRLNC